MITTKAKLMRVGNSLALIIPQVVCNNYNMKKGQEFIIGLHDDGLIVPVKLNEHEYEIKVELKSKSAVVYP